MDRPPSFPIDLIWAPNLFEHRRHSAYYYVYHADDPRKKNSLPVDNLEIQPLANCLNRLPGTEYAVASHRTPLEPLLLPADGTGHSAIAHQSAPFHSLLGCKDGRILKNSNS